MEAAEQKQHRAGFVAVVGRPNAGKSTLVNKLVGEKVAIISDRPQTTRNRILSILSTAEAQVIFLDTPKVLLGQLGEHMVRAAEGAIQDVDLVLYVVDASEKFGKGEETILERLRNSCRVPAILVLNKIDQLGDKSRLLPIIARFQKEYDFKTVVSLSALEDTDFSALLEEIIRSPALRTGFLRRICTRTSRKRSLAAEIIREKVLQLTRDEVPHAVAVQVQEMKTRDNGMVYVRADLFVERDSQKAILIGNKGSMLKKSASVPGWILKTWWAAGCTWSFG